MTLDSPTMEAKVNVALSFALLAFVVGVVLLVLVVFLFIWAKQARRRGGGALQGGINPVAGQKNGPNQPRPRPPLPPPQVPIGADGMPQAPPPLIRRG